MKVDGSLDANLSAVPRQAAELEARGYAGAVVAETCHDPFLPIALAAQRTERLELATGIAVAFPRSPMHLAYVGHDLNALSGGRFALGLGSQVKAHNERRFSTPWSRPVARMRELILALKAIWRAWDHDETLDFRGEFYTHTLMTPFFDPGPNPHGPPPVLLAAVGVGMTEVAGEVADGMLVHGFTTERYVREVTLPALKRGFARRDVRRGDFQLSCPILVVTGSTEEEMSTARRAVQGQLAFYASTPSYRAVLELHGWGDLQGELNALSKAGRWAEMGGLIDAEMLGEFAIVAEPDKVATSILARYGDVFDRVNFYAPYRADRVPWASIAAALAADTTPPRRSADVGREDPPS